MARSGRAGVLERALEACFNGEVDALPELFTDDVSGWSPNMLVTSRDELAEVVAERDESLSNVSAADRRPRRRREQGLRRVPGERGVLGPVRDRRGHRDRAERPRAPAREPPFVAEFDGDTISAFRNYFDNAALLEQMLVRSVSRRAAGGRLVPPRRRGLAGPGRPGAARGAGRRRPPSPPPAWATTRSSGSSSGTTTAGSSPASPASCGAGAASCRRCGSTSRSAVAGWRGPSWPARKPKPGGGAARSSSSAPTTCWRPGLYERLGYETVGVIEGCPAGSTARWYRKDL